jgi:hypothetical protein
LSLTSIVGVEAQDAVGARVRATASGLDQVAALRDTDAVNADDPVRPSLCTTAWYVLTAATPPPARRLRMIQEQRSRAV